MKPSLYFLLVSGLMLLSVFGETNAAEVPQIVLSKNTVFPDHHNINLFDGGFIPIRIGSYLVTAQTNEVIIVPQAFVEVSSSHPQMIAAVIGGLDGILRGRSESKTADVGPFIPPAGIQKRIDVYVQLYAAPNGETVSLSTKLIVPEAIGAKSGAVPIQGSPVIGQTVSIKIPPSYNVVIAGREDYQDIFKISFRAKSKEKIIMVIPGPLLGDSAQSISSVNTIEGGVSVTYARKSFLPGVNIKKEQIGVITTLILEKPALVVLEETVIINSRGGTLAITPELWSKEKVPGVATSVKAKDKLSSSWGEMKRR